MATEQSGSSRVTAFEVGAAVGLSAVFVVLAVVLSPLAAAAMVTPASIAAGLWRAHTMPRRTPHSLSVPVFPSTAVIKASKVSSSVGAKNVTTAA